MRYVIQVNCDLLFNFFNIEKFMDFLTSKNNKIKNHMI